jgi:hypothetical protein
MMILEIVSKIRIQPSLGEDLTQRNDRDLKCIF